VHGEKVQSWKERLPEIVHGYSKENIWNMDETGVFWQALPETGFGQKGKECRGGKKSKQRIIAAFFVTADVAKENPIVIWHSENPRCVKRFDKSALPVWYYSQKKFWMTAELLQSILTKLNNRLAHTNQSKLLFMDNAGCNPHHLQSFFFLTSPLVSCLPTLPHIPATIGFGNNPKFKVYYRHCY